MSQIARGQISTTFWYWTADAIDIKTGVVKRDAIKHDVNFLPATQSSIEISKTVPRSSLKKYLVHEHTVPRMFLTDYILKNNFNVKEIHLLLENFCRAVIVTKDEDAILKKFKLNKTMPLDWNWETGSPYARYASSNIFCRNPKSAN